MLWGICVRSNPVFHLTDDSGDSSDFDKFDSDDSNDFDDSDGFLTTLEANHLNHEKTRPGK